MLRVAAGRTVGQNRDAGHTPKTSISERYLPSWLDLVAGTSSVIHASTPVAILEQMTPY